VKLAQMMLYADRCVSQNITSYIVFIHFRKAAYATSRHFQSLRNK
jgi:hypothetical protein